MALEGRFGELAEALPSLEEMGVTPEIVEAAAEIADSSDVLGVERHTIELLRRLSVFLR
jgi:hypothetical protein